MTSPGAAAFSSTNPKTNPKPCLVMKPIIPFALLGAFFAVGAAKAASTDPVGYVSLGNPDSSGLPAVPADTDFFVSIPLDRETTFAGLVDNVSGSDINIQGTPGLGDLITVPHIVKITSGSGEGVVALITANTTSAITVALQPGQTLTGVSNGTSISIQKAWTVKSLFEASAFPDGTQLLGFSGTSPGTNLSSDISYEIAGGAWTNLSSFLPGDDDVLYPGEGFVVRTATSAIADIVISGEVPTSNHRVVVSNLDAANGQDNVIGFTSPVNENLGTSGLGFNSGDQIILFDDVNATGSVVAAGTNKSSVTTLEYTAGSPGVWTDLGSFLDVTNTFELRAGESFIYRVVAGAALGDVQWANEQDYIPGL
jgi:uncharacterized protein (TIGR02597 family)